MTETVRQVAPGNACSCNPEDGLNEQAVVRAGAARITGLAGQVRLHPLPLMVLQQQPNRRHPTLPEKELESDFRPSRNPKCQRALARMLKVQPIPVGEDTPMSTADWRSADAYQELRSLDAP